MCPFLVQVGGRLVSSLWSGIWCIWCIWCAAGGESEKGPCTVLPWVPRPAPALLGVDAPVVRPLLRAVPALGKEGGRILGSWGHCCLAAPAALAWMSGHRGAPDTVPRPEQEPSVCGRSGLASLALGWARSSPCRLSPSHWGAARLGTKTSPGPPPLNGHRQWDSAFPVRMTDTVSKYCFYHLHVHSWWFFLLLNGAGGGCRLVKAAVRGARLWALQRQTVQQQQQLPPV